MEAAALNGACRHVKQRTKARPSGLDCAPRGDSNLGDGKNTTAADGGGRRRPTADSDGWRTTEDQSFDRDRQSGIDPL